MRRTWMDEILADARRDIAEKSAAAREEWRRQVREATLAQDGVTLRRVVQEGREKGWAL